MIGQVESYRERFGYYPEAVLGDQIYGTRENRKYLKAKGIRYSVEALGRPRKLSKEEKRLLSEEGRQRILFKIYIGQKLKCNELKRK